MFLQKSYSAIEWINKDNAIHTVRVTHSEAIGSPAAYFDSSLIQAGGTFEHTFAEIAKVDRYCTLHPWIREGYNRLC